MLRPPVILALALTVIAVLLPASASAGDMGTEGPTTVGVAAVHHHTTYDRDPASAALRASRDAFRDDHIADVVVIVTADAGGWPDALSASALAGYGPVLFAENNPSGPWPILDEAIEEIHRVLKPNGQVLVVGGTSRIPSAVVNRLRAQVDQTVIRLAGDGRVHTSAIVGRYVTDLNRAHGNPTPGLFLATAASFADAIASAPVAGRLHAPIILADPNVLRPARDFIRLSTTPRADQSHDIDNDVLPADVVVLGGTGAISDGVAEHLADGRSLIRLAGPGREATAAAIYQTLITPGIDQYGGFGPENRILMADLRGDWRTMLGISHMLAEQWRGILDGRTIDRRSTVTEQDQGAPPVVRDLGSVTGAMLRGGTCARGDYNFEYIHAVGNEAPGHVDANLDDRNCGDLPDWDEIDLVYMFELGRHNDGFQYRTASALVDTSVARGYTGVSGGPNGSFTFAQVQCGFDAAIADASGGWDDSRLQIDDLYRVSEFLTEISRFMTGEVIGVMTDLVTDLIAAGVSATGVGTIPATAVNFVVDQVMGRVTDELARIYGDRWLSNGFIEGAWHRRAYAATAANLASYHHCYSAS
jgi:putative cell wall-binding protein